MKINENHKRACGFFGAVCRQAGAFQQPDGNASGLPTWGTKDSIPTWESFLIDQTKQPKVRPIAMSLEKNQFLWVGNHRTLHSPARTTAAVHPAYDLMFDNFAPDAYKNNPKARTQWQ